MCRTAWPPQSLLTAQYGVPTQGNSTYTHTHTESALCGYLRWSMLQIRVRTYWPGLAAMSAAWQEDFRAVAQAPKSSKHRPRELEATVISVRRHNGDDPPDLTGMSLVLQAAKRGSKPAVTALPFQPHLAPLQSQGPAVEEDLSSTLRLAGQQEAADNSVPQMFNMPEVEQKKEEALMDDDEEVQEQLQDMQQGVHFFEDPTEQPVSNVATSDPRWTNGIIQILERLNSHQKFRKEALLARRRYKNNMWLAFKLAFWMLVVGLPVIVYPIAEFFNTWSVRSSKYMASYGMAMMNFCFLLGPCLGASVRYTLEGFIGCLLALGNALLMNRAFGSYMNGGAFTSREEATDVAMGQIIYASEWLPLCNLGNGERFVQTNSTFEFLRECFINVHWSSVTEGSVRSLIVLGNLALFTGVFLWIGFGTCVRVYATCS